jgi:hypothetical protein
MLRFLWLVLADEGAPATEPITGARGEGDSAARGSRFLSSGLFERLLLDLDRAPERLDQLNSLLKELRQGSDGEDLLPEGFDAIWEPIWSERQQRSKT